MRINIYFHSLRVLISFIFIINVKNLIIRDINLFKKQLFTIIIYIVLKFALRFLSLSQHHIIYKTIRQKLYRHLKCLYTKIFRS